MLKINNFTFVPGDSIYCIIKKTEITDAKIWFEENQLKSRQDVYDAYICHNNSLFDGAVGHTKLGYRYSWMFHIRDGKITLGDGVTLIEPFLSLDRKQSEISTQLSSFLRLNELDNFLPLFNYKIGIFDEFNLYEISENEGFILLKNDKKSMEIKFSRFIRQMAVKFNEIALDSKCISKFEITDRAIELMYNKFISFQKDNTCVINFLQGDEIDKAYTKKNYLDESGGTLHNSCMTDKTHFLDLYKKNPNQVKLAVIYINDKIASRCLVWTTTDGKQHSDRVYYKHDWLEQFTTNKLIELGIDPLKDKSIKIVQLEKWQFDHYPYLDSFFYIDREAGVLLSVGRGVENLRSTEGRIN